FAYFGGTTPFDALTAGAFAPTDHLPANRAHGNAVRTDFHIVVYQFAGTPEVQVDDGGDIIVFQQGIDREGVVGRIQDRLSHFPTRIPVTELAVAANPGHGVMPAGAKQSRIDRKIVGTVRSTKHVEGSTVVIFLTVAVPAPIGIGI
ncbi:hypothetical protein, partial [Effusibacillus consociatus]